MKRAVCRSRIRGLSLVELMVSLAIGVVVIGAIMVSYLSSGRTTREQAAYAEMHENAQMGLTVLSRELLLAGYAQPSGAPAVVAPAVATFSRTYEERPVFGCDNGFVSANTIGAVACSAVGTPALEIVYEADTTNTVPVAVGGGLPDVPSDCKGAQIRPATGVLSGVDFFVTFNRYFVAIGPAGRPELYCASRTQNVAGGAVPAAVLVDNVEAMQIWYGEANPGDPRQVARYVTAANVTDWTRLVSVRVCLLMRSSEPVLDLELTAAPTYLNCNSVAQNFPNRFLRRAYFTTATLRNRMAF